MSCPVCQSTSEPKAQIGPLAVCGACGASLVVDDSGVRRATGADTASLSAADLQTLRASRGRTR